MNHPFIVLLGIKERISRNKGSALQVNFLKGSVQFADKNINPTRKWSDDVEKKDRHFVQLCEESLFAANFHCIFHRKMAASEL